MTTKDRQSTSTQTLVATPMVTTSEPRPTEAARPPVGLIRREVRHARRRALLRALGLDRGSRGLSRANVGAPAGRQPASVG